MASVDGGNLEREKSRQLPALPGEKLVEAERPVFVPVTNEGPTSYKINERTHRLVVYSGGRALAMYNIGGHDDPDDPIDIDRLVEDMRGVIRRSDLDYEVGEYLLKKEEGRLLEPVEVFDSQRELGVKHIFDYQGDDGLPDE